MVTTYNASKMVSGTQPRYLPDGAGVEVYSSISLTTALVANDIVNMLTLSADASNLNGYGPTVMGIVIDVDQLDSNGTATITLDLGDIVTGASGTPQRFFAASTIAKAGGYAIPNVAATLGYQPFASSFATYTTASNLTDTIYFTCHAAAATWKNGNARIVFSYSFDP